VPVRGNLYESELLTVEANRGNYHWDNAIARTVGINRILDNQWLDTSTGDTYWVQNETFPPIVPVGAVVTLDDTAPTSDRWNFVAVEILIDD
jgi:hypothetical protein